MLNEHGNEECVYCGALANTRDHFIPISFQRSCKRTRTKTFRGQKNNLVPACKECNCLASDKVFETIEKKREYISERLERKYKKLISLPDWSNEELKTVSIKLQKTIKIKMIIRRWIVNRIHYPTIIYPENTFSEEMKNLLSCY